MRMHKKAALCLILALLFLLSACGEPGPSNESRSLPTEEPPQRSVQDAKPYREGAFLSASFHSEAAEGPENARIDLSGTGEGYVAVSARSKQRLKFQVITETATYNYDLASDGAPSVFPLQSGSGSYRFRVMENIGEAGKYAELYSAEAEVSLSDEFQPFLRPSDYVNYNQSSECVKKARELAAGCEKDVEVVDAVMDFVCSNVKYDRQKAATVSSGYLPSPDETMRSGCGICFDYASLAAAMLRSQGVPTKLVFGYVAPDSLYHAWNLFYTEATGWVAASYTVDEKGWVRVDLTFVAGGADRSFIGDGSNYADLYYY